MDIKTHGFIIIPWLRIRHHAPFFVPLSTFAANVVDAIEFAYLTQNKLSSLDLYIYAILTSKSPCTKANQMSDSKDPKQMQGIKFEPYILSYIRWHSTC